MPQVLSSNTFYPKRIWSHRRANRKLIDVKRIVVKMHLTPWWQEEGRMLPDVLRELLRYFLRVVVMHNLFCCPSWQLCYNLKSTSAIAIQQLKKMLLRNFNSTIIILSQLQVHNVRHFHNFFLTWYPCRVAGLLDYYMSHPLLTQSEKLVSDIPQMSMMVICSHFLN